MYCRWRCSGSRSVSWRARWRAGQPSWAILVPRSAQAAAAPACTTTPYIDIEACGIIPVASFSASKFARERMRARARRDQLCARQRANLRARVSNANEHDHSGRFFLSQKNVPRPTLRKNAWLCDLLCAC
jgi:hypothetical protein